jgi:cellulose biosynthesis protein BcsQ
MLIDYATQMDTSLFKTFIRESVSVREAQTVRQSLIDYAPKSNPNKDYISFTDELMQRLGE